MILLVKSLCFLLNVEQNIAYLSVHCLLQRDKGIPSVLPFTSGLLFRKVFLKTIDKSQLIFALKFIFKYPSWQAEVACMGVL